MRGAIGLGTRGSVDALRVVVDRPASAAAAREMTLAVATRSAWRAAAADAGRASRRRGRGGRGCRHRARRAEHLRRRRLKSPLPELVRPRNAGERRLRALDLVAEELARRATGRRPRRRRAHVGLRRLDAEELPGQLDDAPGFGSQTAQVGGVGPLRDRVLHLVALQVVGDLGAYGQSPHEKE